MKKIVLLFVIFISCAGLQTYAQAPKVRLGNIESATATCDQILSFPRLLIMNPTCVVKSFSMSFRTQGDKVFGPYKASGPELTDEQIKLIKEFKGMSTKIVIEDIKSSCKGGPETTLAPIVVTYDH